MGTRNNITPPQIDFYKIEEYNSDKFYDYLLFFQLHKDLE